MLPFTDDPAGSLRRLAFTLVPSACDDAQAARRLREAIDALAPLPRMLLTLYHFEDVSIPGIAQITALPPGTIKSHLFRARLRLRERLESGDFP